MTSNISDRFDSNFPEFMRVDGSSNFRRIVVPQLLENLPSGSLVYDLGAGRIPAVSKQTKEARSLRLIGIDLYADEMAEAPLGLYDEAIAADVITYKGRGDADLVVSHCLMEHVQDNTGSWKALASMLKPGGRAALFQPCRNAAFARFNLICPEPIAKALLSLQKGRQNNGWKAYYNKCTPKGFADLAESNGLEVVRVQSFWMAGYYKVFFPLHFLWRVYQAMARKIFGEEMCESFLIEVRKPL